MEPNGPELLLPYKSAILQKLKSTDVNRTIDRELVIVIGVVALAIMAMSLLQPMLPLYLTSIGVSPTVLGLMFAVGMMGMVLGESSGGWLADRAGIRVPMFIGTFLCAPLVLSFAFARSTALVFAVFFFWGAVRAAVFGPGRGYIGATISLSRKATFMAIYATAMAISRSLGNFTSGFIADALGYEGIFYIAAGIALLAGILASVGLRRRAERMPALKTHIGPYDLSEKPVALYRQRPFVIQCIIAALHFTAIGVLPFLSLLAVQVAGLKTTQVGILFTISSFSSVVFLIPMGRLADRRNKKNMMALGMLVSALSVTGISLSTNFLQLAVCQVIGSLGTSMYNPAAVALLSQNVSSRRQSTAMGIYGGSENIGLIIGSALGGVLWSALGPTPTFLIVGTLSASLGSAMSFFFLKGRSKNPLFDGAF